MLTPSACRAEVTGLHAFFVEWFTGRADGPSPARLEDALAPEFEMVTPAGEDGRVSTALFRADRTAPEGVLWVTVQETRLDS